MIQIGIDPGLSGAIAVLDNEKCIGIWDMPTMQKSKGKNQVDPYQLSDLLRQINPVMAWVELVSAMPGQGVTSMFSFGEGCGVIRGCLAAKLIPFQYILPREWKAYFKLKGKDKQASIPAAKQLIPSSSEWIHLKKHSGRADALLIAKFGSIVRDREVKQKLVKR